MLNAYILMSIHTNVNIYTGMRVDLLLCMLTSIHSNYYTYPYPFVCTRKNGIP
jgi:hypothetical protein